AAVVYKIYGTVFEDFAAGNTKSLSSRFIKYKGDKVSASNIKAAKKYLMSNAEKCLDDDLRGMAYFSLGYHFTENKEVVLWLFKMFMIRSLPLDERTTALDALISSSGEKYKYIAIVALKSWLGSTEPGESKRALNVLKYRGKPEKELLPDLITCFLQSEKKSIDLRRLVAVLKLYNVNDLLSYHELLKKVSDIRLKNLHFKKMVLWLDSQKALIKE
ncbi:MAG: hypothetical protein HRT88_09645, partial [Lentisphaeraceae bacterium]|nr:hypothetical protein [Lentisphaeraceae bacterium]